MDLLFHLSNGDRATSLLNLMHSFSCSYICLWNYSSDTNFLYCIEGYCNDGTVSQLVATSSSSGSSARRFFDEYKASFITVGNDLVPGLASKHRNPYLELQELDLLRLASVESQRQFYKEARIKNAVFLGCERGEIELGMPYIPQMSLEIKMQNIFPEDFARQHSSPMVHSNIPPPPPEQKQQQQSCRASPSSSFSLGSPEYSLLFYAIPSSSNLYLQEQCTTTTKTLTIPITTTTNDLLIPFPSQESTDAALTRAYLAILSASPSSSSASSQQKQQQQEASAFKRYPTAGLRPIIGSSDLRRQTMLKRAIAYFRGLNDRRLQEQQALIGSRPTSTQLHHMISERRRREKINESFQALRSLLPPATKKDKASVLRTTKEYLSSIKSQLSELSKRNEFLEAQLFPRSKKTTPTTTKQVEISTNERLSVWITPISESTSVDHHRLVDLQVALRGQYPATNLLIRVLEFLNQVREVCLISMESRTLQRQTVGDHPSPTSWATFRLRIEGSEWDESAFKKAVRRILADLAQ